MVGVADRVGWYGSWNGRNGRPMMYIFKQRTVAVLYSATKDDNDRDKERHGVEKRTMHSHNILCDDQAARKTRTYSPEKC